MSHDGRAEGVLSGDHGDWEHRGVKKPAALGAAEGIPVLGITDATVK